MSLPQVERIESQAQIAGASEAHCCCKGATAQERAEQYETRHTLLQQQHATAATDTMSLTLDDLAATSGTAAQDLALKSKELTQKQVVQVPIARTTERRAQRQLAYDETTKTVNEWDSTIDAERKTSSLNFGKREAEQTSTSQLASSFFADTPLERRVEQILQSASAHTDRAVKAREDEALGDDAEERRKELAKTRSLLFFAERKAKYHAKVKSKAYARLRRKRLKKRDEAAREAAAEADPSLREARDDELATKRAQERMDLRHASTSAWARSTKMRGRGAVESRRREMRDNEALRRELAKKQEQSSSDEESDDESREELIAKARASLGECVDSEEPGSALLNMKFMVKAREAQRARAREDAEKLLEELEAENSSSDDDDEDGAALRELAALSGDAPAEAEAPPTVALQGNSLKVRRKRGGGGAAAAAGRRLMARRRRRGHEEGASGRAPPRRPQRPGARAPGSRRRARLERDAAAPCPRSNRGSRAAAIADGVDARARERGAPVQEDAPLTKLSQQDLLHMAFDDKDQEDFAAQRFARNSNRNGRPSSPTSSAGGSWTGERARAASGRRSARRHPDQCTADGISSPRTRA